MSKVLESTIAETPETSTPLSHEDTFYPVEPQTEVAKPDTAAAAVKETAASTETATELQTAKPEAKVETADELALKAKTGRRFQELLDRNKALETELAQVRQPKTEDPQALKAPVEPNPDTFTGTWDELKTAQAKYTKDLVAYELQKDRAAQTEAAQQARIQEYNDGVTKIWNTRSAETIKRNADYRQLVQESDTAPISADLLKGINATANQFFCESEVGPDLLLHYAKHPAEREKLYAMNTWACSRELIRMEDQILEQLKPAKQITTAPRKGVDLTGTGSGLPKEQSLEDTFWD